MSKKAARATAQWDTAVECAHVVKWFDQTRAGGLLKRETSRLTALNDVSFTIRRGEFVAYAGPNGAGKSTTFKLLCGMLSPQSGTVRAMGMDPLRDRIPLMERTGVLFGNRSELWQDHPVRNSFLWKKVVWNIPDESYTRMLKEICDLLGVEEWMDRFARELSLGQRMRANLALALLHDPQLLLLDEPTLGMDVLAKRQMIDFLKRINQTRGTTILVTSHDMDDLTEMAKRIMLIHEGALTFDGTYDALMRMTGDKRVIRITREGAPPTLPGTEWTGSVQGKHSYAYQAADISVTELLRRVAEIPGVQDVETGRVPIESVIADLYRQWTA